LDAPPRTAHAKTQRSNDDGDDDGEDDDDDDDEDDDDDDDDDDDSDDESEDEEEDDVDDDGDDGDDPSTRLRFSGDDDGAVGACSLPGDALRSRRPFSAQRRTVQYRSAMPRCSTDSVAGLAFSQAFPGGNTAQHSTV
jgi:hypothetical protein